MNPDRLTQAAMIASWFKTVTTHEAYSWLYKTDLPWEQVKAMPKRDILSGITGTANSNMVCLHEKATQGEFDEYALCDECGEEVMPVVDDDESYVVHWRAA